MNVKFKADNEQKQEDAEFREEGDFTAITDQSEEGRPQKHADNNITDNDRLAETSEDTASGKSGSQYKGNLRKV